MISFHLNVHKSQVHILYIVSNKKYIYALQTTVQFHILFLSNKCHIGNDRVRCWLILLNVDICKGTAGAGCVHTFLWYFSKIDDVISFIALIISYC